MPRKKKGSYNRPYLFSKPTDLNNHLKSSFVIHPYKYIKRMMTTEYPYYI